MTAALVQQLKDNNEDFEWYPTTEEILTCIKKNICENFGDHRFNDENKQPAVSVLDCGAGDGRVLESLACGGDMYAIEKSKHLILEMPADVCIVGTDFYVNTLIDKQADVVFCNPPYSEYQQWAVKIIKEANAKWIYLVIPNRWSDSQPIDDALKAREAKTEVLGSFNFLNAERQARAVVEIVAVNLSKKYDRYNRHQEMNVDPFELWFDEYFAINAEQETGSDYAEEKVAKATLSEKLQGSLVEGRGLIQVLVELYNNELQHLIGNYEAVGRLDSALLYELGVSVSSLQGGLKHKISGLKAKYWNEFFSNYKQLTSRLTSGSRESMLKRLQEHVSIDFSESNALAITAWAIKNANMYYDKQLITIFESMVDEANVVMYKSNLRTWGKEDWRYCGTGRVPKHLNRYGLELRIVLYRHTAIQGGGYGYSFDFENGLHKDAHQFIENLITIAGNLGFVADQDSRQRLWSSGKKQVFTADDGDLMEVKAFKNGNLHIKFNQLFIRTLNVEFGRLKGWLKNKEQAAEDLNIPIEEVTSLFDCNHQISQSAVPLICHRASEEEK